jgi:hypothetical protein
MHAASAVFAMSIGTVKTIAIVIIIAILATMYLVGKFVKAVTMKAVMILVLAAIVLGAWTQRTKAADCFERVKANPRGGETCEFFGVSVSTPK